MHNKCCRCHMKCHFGGILKSISICDRTTPPWKNSSSHKTFRLQIRWQFPLSSKFDAQDPLHVGRTRCCISGAWMMVRPVQPVFNRICNNKQLVGVPWFVSLAQQMGHCHQIQAASTQCCHFAMPNLVRNSQYHPLFSRKSNASGLPSFSGTYNMVVFWNLPFLRDIKPGSLWNDSKRLATWIQPDMLQDEIVKDASPFKENAAGM